MCKCSDRCCCIDALVQCVNVHMVIANVDVLLWCVDVPIVVAGVGVLLCCVNVPLFVADVGVMCWYSDDCCWCWCVVMLC